MLITKEELINQRDINIKSDSEIDNDDLNHIENFICINQINVYANAKYIPGMDMAVVSIQVKGSLKLNSTRSLVPVEVDINEKDELTYVFSHHDDLTDQDIIEVDDRKIELHDAIVSLIITAIPIKIIAENEPESFCGDSWEVISEDQYEKRKKEATDPRFEELKNFEL